MHTNDIQDVQNDTQNEVAYHLMQNDLQVT